MELYTLDPDNKFIKKELIEGFESLIWSERYASYGEMTLVTEDNLKMRQILQPDVLVGFSESKYVMQVLSILLEEDDNGKRTLTAKGKSLEWVLEGRPAKAVLNTATWDINGTIGAILKYMVDVVCINGTGINVDDVIPKLASVNLAGRVTGTYNVSVETGSLYERIKEIADAFSVGFRITLANPGADQLMFSPYTGSNLTLAAPDVPGQVVIFSADTDTLYSTSTLVSREDFKNGAYIFSEHGSRMVPAPGILPMPGLKRRILLIDATDIDTVAGATLQAQLDQRALQQLAQHNEYKLFDGVVNPAGVLRYNYHYHLGDFVTFRAEDGSTQNMLVTEYIYSIDGAGFNAYPTLSVGLPWS